MKTVLVTGCGGFIGGHVCVALKAAGYRVIGIDNKHRLYGWTQPDACPSYELIDIGDPSSWIAAGDYDLEHNLCVHLAAASRMGPCAVAPANAVSSNVAGTAAVLALALQSKAPVIYAGSATAEDPEATLYSLTKFQGEQLCRLWSRDNGIPVCIARFSNVYGPYEWADGLHATVVAKFDKQYRDGEQLTIYGTGLQTRDFIDARDVARAIVLLAGRLLNGAETLQTVGVGTGVATRIIDVARRRVWNNMARVSYVAGPPNEIAVAPKVDRILRDWGWRPNHDVMHWIDFQRSFVMGSVGCIV